MVNPAAPATTTAGIPAAGVGSLSTLLRRLEAATSRLEDIAMTQSTTGGPHFVSGASAVQPAAPSVVSPGPAPSTKAAEESSPAIKAFDELIEGPLAKYAALSQELGGLIAEQAQQTVNGFKAQKAYIQLAAACKKPSSPASFEPIIKPTQQALMAVIDIKEKNRASKQSNQLTVVAEGIPALGWVMMDSKPGPYVGEHKDAADFWVNKVIKEFKESNPKQVEWARSFTSTLDALRKYIMQFHTTSLTWNPNGVPVESYAAAAPALSAGGAPPPPPPPPPAPPAAPSAPPAPSATRSAAAPAAGDMGAVFSALNQGESVTKGLKKVDKSEMTHKNPELRGTAPIGSTSPTLGKGPQKPPKPSSIQKKPPKTALEGKAWTIENHENNQMILIDETELNQVVNVYNVKSSVIQIKGKVNAISLVNCAKVSVLLDSTVSSVAISSSPSFTVQILGKVPTILIDGTDGGQVYLSKESLDVEIITAKTSAINISLPVEGEEEGIFAEKAVPEQLKTVVVNGKLVTSVVEHSG